MRASRQNKKSSRTAESSSIPGRSLGEHRSFNAHTESAGASVGAGHDFGRIPSHPPILQTKLTVNTPGDRYEQEADRVADQVMRTVSSPMPIDTANGIPQIPHRSIQRKPNPSGEELPAETTAEIGELSSHGRPMSRAERDTFEPRFGADFSGVRLHDGPTATRLAGQLTARAFTIGSDIAFASGEYAPGTSRGDRLLAHELTHVVQQGAADRSAGGNGTQASVQGTLSSPRVQRQSPPAAQTPDPLCATYTYATKKSVIDGKIGSLKTTPDIEVRMQLIQELKWVLRCSTDAEKTEVKTKLDTDLGATEGAAIWKEAATPFGGYRGMYPGYYGAKSRLQGLGMSQVEGFDPFAYNPRTDSNTTKWATGRESTATAEAPTVTKTDILYFYGHQYAQYGAPGAFANGDQTQFVDLTALSGKGDFSRVKLIISTSCATCCKEAIEVFAPLFPNAVILGYRKSAPIKGEDVRNDFDKKIRGLKKPLLLDQPVDVDAIIEVWKSVIMSYHPNEKERLPGYYRGGTVHYLESGVWKSMPGTDNANTCKKKGERIEEAAGATH